MNLGITGRVAIVTGASKGIGLATSLALADEGVSVVMAARDSTDLAIAAQQVVQSGGVVRPVPCDVMDRDSAVLLQQSALDAFGRIDIIVNNAGGGGSSLAEFDEDEWLALYTLNVTSVMRLTMACMQNMRDQRWGRIVNVGSTMSRACDPRFGPYGAAKAAVLHVSRNLAQAFSKDNVLTNCVLPGLTRTHGVVARMAELASTTRRTEAQIEDRMMDRQPIAIGRLGEPAEVASVIVFLCSERSSWTTGAEVLVDGGTIAVVP